MFRFVTLTTGFVLTVSFSLAQDSATFEGLGDLPGGPENSWAIGVSADGAVVSGLSSSQNGFQEAMRWEDGVMEGLGDFPGGSFYSVSYDVSSDGSVLVGSSISGKGSEAFRWLADPALVGGEDGEMIGLGDLPGGTFYSEAFGVSGDGSVVVGGSESENGTEAFRWTADADTMIGLGDFPGGHFRSWAYDVSADGSVVVGSGSFGMSEDDTEAFRWVADPALVGGEVGADTLVGLGDLPGGIVSSVAWAVSPDGSVVVGQSSSADGFEAFRWTEGGGMEGLGDLPGGFFFSYAQAVSADGSLVGGYGFTTTSTVEAFLWTEDDGIRNLKDVLESDYGLDLNGWTLISVRDISDDGTVLVGEGVNSRGDSEGWRVFLGKPVADETTPHAPGNQLSAPKPNPVRGSASLTLRVSEAQDVVVEVYDALGRRVQTLFEGALPAGGGETLTLDASTLPAGVYAIRAAGVDFTHTRPITIVH